MFKKISFVLLAAASLSLQADEDDDLYFSPGGKYTESDIIANQNLTPAEKYKGFKPSHNPRTKAGMVICPITLTQANPRCTWVVGGKTYQFCCPICIDEFLRIAKESPEEIKDPEEYVKK